MQPWTSDVTIDDEIALGLLCSRFPELGDLKLRLMGSGWDNHAYLVNDEIVFRIPHRKQGAELMEQECLALGHLNRFEFPLRIPNPQYNAPPDKDFPYRIAGYPLIEGQTADFIEWTIEERAANAESIGRFLSKLHSVPTDVPFAIGDELRRADLPFRAPKLIENLGDAPAGFREVLADLASTPLVETPVWVHGDLYSRHLVVDNTKKVCGIIDWGDTHVGDPALDIAIAWMFLPACSWPDLKKAYGGIDENTWRRARFRAMGHWIYLSGYAKDKADANLLRELEFVLGNVMAVE